jgi:hypothetical protein
MAVCHAIEMERLQLMSSVGEFMGLPKVFYIFYDREIQIPTLCFFVLIIPKIKSTNSELTIHN